MDGFSREQVDRFVEDISFVKRAIQKNTSVLQQMDFRTSLRLTILLSAIGTFLFCGLFHLLIRHFGGFAAIPANVKAISFSGLALACIAIGFIKNAGVLKSARNVDPGVSLFRLAREYYSVRVYHHFVPLALVLVFSIVYVCVAGNPQLIVPILAIGAGLIFNGFGALLRVEEFLWASYWAIVTGAIVLVFHTMSPLVGISLTAGCSLALLAIILYLPQKKRQET